MAETTEIKGIRPLARPLDRPIRLGVLISGGGTTLVNFLRRIEAGQLMAEIPIVIGSRPNIGGLEHARNAGIRAEVVARKECKSVDEFSDRIFSLLREVRADLVPLSGFLSLIRIPSDFTNRVLNIHNALDSVLLRKGTLRPQSPLGGPGSWGQTERLHGPFRGQPLRPRSDHRAKSRSRPRRRYARNAGRPCI